MGSLRQSSQELEVEALLRQMKAGDRDAAAAFITRYGSRVRRRVRGKLGPAMRRLFDSEEILSTVGRRLDLYVRNGGLEVDGAAQLWSLIFTMADNAVIDKLRIIRRLNQVESQDSAFAHSLLSRLRRADREEPEGAQRVIEQAMRILSSDGDHEVLDLWLSGLKQESIAQELGVEVHVVWKRWERIKDKLRKHLGDEAQR